MLLSMLLAYERLECMYNATLSLGRGTKGMIKETKQLDLAPLPLLGTRAKRTRTITEDDIERFAEVSGDHNPLHLDAAYAAQTIFGERVAHGFLTASLISAIIGNDLPGPGTIYLGQTLKFLGAVHIGDTLTVSVEAIAVREDKRLMTLRTNCINQDGTVVLTGEATVKYSHEAGAI
jgi:3-hydroxybutyryl-CoA dehydratase